MLRDRLTFILLFSTKLSINLFNGLPSRFREVHHCVKTGDKAYDGEEKERPMYADEVANVREPFHLDKVAQFCANVCE